MKTRNSIIYVVSLVWGQIPEEYNEEEIFATSSIVKAEMWKKKYNRIVNENIQRIKHYYDDKNYDKPKLFWYDELRYDEPKAHIAKIEFRDNYQVMKKYSISLVYTKQIPTRFDMKLRVLIIDANSKDEATGKGINEFREEMKGYSLNLIVTLEV